MEWCERNNCPNPATVNVKLLKGVKLNACFQHVSWAIKFLTVPGDVSTLEVKRY